MRPSASCAACRGAAATGSSSSCWQDFGRRRRMLASRAFCSSSDQQSQRFSANTTGFPLFCRTPRASSSTLVRSLSSTSSTRSACLATRIASRARPAAAISSMPGVSISSTDSSPWIGCSQSTPLSWRVQPWATSVAKASRSSRALSRLDLPTPTRPKTARRICFCSSRCSCRSRLMSSPASRLDSRLLSCNCLRH